MDGFKYHQTCNTKMYTFYREDFLKGVFLGVFIEKEIMKKATKHGCLVAF